MNTVKRALSVGAAELLEQARHEPKKNYRVYSDYKHRLDCMGLSAQEYQDASLALVEMLGV